MVTLTLPQIERKLSALLRIFALSCTLKKWLPKNLRSFCALMIFYLYGGFHRAQLSACCAQFALCCDHFALILR